MSTTHRICECGCGNAIPAGRSIRFLPGHTRFPGYVAQDRGYATPCWIWQGATGHCGYGITRQGTAADRRAQGAHRFYYQREHGPLPDSLGSRWAGFTHSRTSQRW